MPTFPREAFCGGSLLTVRCLGTAAVWDNDADGGFTPHVGKSAAWCLRWHVVK